jgi:hypothetical protein
MVDHGIKPCYIFDGKPPDLKGSVVSQVISEAMRSGLRSISLRNDLLGEKKPRRARKKLEKRVLRRISISWPDVKSESQKSIMRSVRNYYR